MMHPVNVWTGRNDVIGSTERVDRSERDVTTQRNVWSGMKYDVIPSTGLSKRSKDIFG